MPATGPIGQDATTCVFCSIADGSQPSEIIFEDDGTIAFLDIAPATAGHTLVIPKRHTEDLLTVRIEDLSAVVQTTRSVAKILDQQLHPEGLTVFQANRSAGWQDVFHLHFHVVPRWTGDSLVRPWKAGAATADELSAMAGRLRAARIPD
jgi:histidine triad (HIT) family protein